eukprot:SAG22_NODE_5235_length_1056_cov_0.974922_1_plen_246_part_00
MRSGCPQQPADKQLIAQVSGISVAKAKELLNDKLQGRLEGGPAALRRAFQFFDRDGGGTISMEEFDEACKLYLALDFERGLLQQLFAVCAGGTDEIDYKKFAKFVMDEGANARTSIFTDSASKAQASDHNMNSEQFLRRKVRDNWKDLLVNFKHAANKKGAITPEALRHVLYRFDIMPSDDQFEDFCRRMDTDGDGELTYQEFMAFFEKGQDGDKQVTAVITTMSKEQAMTAIRKGIEVRQRSCF